MPLPLRRAGGCLRGQEVWVVSSTATHKLRDLPARRATEWLDALAETWQQTELVEEKSDVIHAIYERIVIDRAPLEMRPPHDIRRQVGLRSEVAMKARRRQVARSASALMVVPR